MVWVKTVLCPQPTQPAHLLPSRILLYRMILMYPTGSVDKNQLLFAVAAYNFANFMVKEFDLAFEEAGPMSMLNISGFTGIEEILQYYKMIYGKDGYAQALDKKCSYPSDLRGQLRDIDAR